MLNSAKRHKQHLAVLCLFVNDLKDINDTFGYEVGDLLLTEASIRLKNKLSSSDYVDSPHSFLKMVDQNSFARFTGNEFTLLLTDIEDPRLVSVVAKRILDALSETYFLKEHQINTSSNIGIAIYPQDGNNVEELLNHSNRAMLRKRVIIVINIVLEQ